VSAWTCSALAVLAFVGCAPVRNPCSEACYPVGFRTSATEGCICMDGGYDVCACAPGPDCRAPRREWKP
jgi:hypothetical protein